MMKFNCNKIVHPQEIEVWHVIPAIRRELANEMKKRNMEQKAIASMLGITEAAISQYLNKKRAIKIVFSKRLKKEISLATDKIIKEKSETTVLQEIQRIMDLPKMREQVCKIHQECECVKKNCMLCRDKN